MSRPTVDHPLPGLNGDAPVIDLHELMGARVAQRKVLLNGREYRFRPMNLITAKLLSENEPVEAFRTLMAEEPDVVEDFLLNVPAANLDEILTAIYGEVSVGEASPRPPSSSRAAAKSKRSRPTSSSEASPSPSS